jgi:hypothetical protein
MAKSILGEFHRMKELIEERKTRADLRLHLNGVLVSYKRGGKHKDLVNAYEELYEFYLRGR